MMVANDDRFRAFNTEHFLTHGLGGKLTRDASAVVEAWAVDTSLRENKLILIQACGSILERTRWLGLGRRLGYFKSDIQPVSAQEKQFLLDAANVVDEIHPWTALHFANFRQLISHLDDSNRTLNSISQTTVQFPRDTTELLSLFQAAHIICEDLTEEPTKSFFRFLDRGDVEHFKSSEPSAEAVFNALRNDYLDAELEPDVLQSDAVVAGFIRYTEFLSAFDGLYPIGRADRSETDLKSDPNQDDWFLSWRPRKSLLMEIKETINWRFPRQSVEAYYAVQSTFLRIASEQFSKYSSSGVSWQSLETLDQLVLHSRSFSDASQSISLELSLKHAEESEARAREMVEKMRDAEHRPETGQGGGGIFAIGE